VLGAHSGQPSARGDRLPPSFGPNPAASSIPGEDWSVARTNSRLVLFSQLAAIATLNGANVALAPQNSAPVRKAGKLRTSFTRPTSTACFAAASTRATT